MIKRCVVIFKPTIVYPIQDQQDYNTYIYSSPFKTGVFYGSSVFHESSDWELYDADTNVKVAYLYKTQDYLTYWFPVMEPNKHYLVRVRYRYKNIASEWSDKVSFYTPNTVVPPPFTPPDPANPPTPGGPDINNIKTPIPTISILKNDSNKYYFKLKSSPFEVVDPTQPLQHVKTTWKIYKDNNDVLFEETTDIPEQLTERIVDTITPVNGVTYTVEVIYIADNNNQSNPGLDSTTFTKVYQWVDISSPPYEIWSTSIVNQGYYNGKIYLVDTKPSGPFDYHFEPRDQTYTYTNLDQLSRLDIIVYDIQEDKYTVENKIPLNITTDTYYYINIQRNRISTPGAGRHDTVYDYEADCDKEDDNAKGKLTVKEDIQILNVSSFYPYPRVCFYLEVNNRYPKCTIPETYGYSISAKSTKIKHAYTKTSYTIKDNLLYIYISVIPVFTEYGPPSTYLTFLDGSSSPVFKSPVWSKMKLYVYDLDSKKFIREGDLNYLPKDIDIPTPSTQRPIVLDSNQGSNDLYKQNTFKYDLRPLWKQYTQPIYPMISYVGKDNEIYTEVGIPHFDIITADNLDRLNGPTDYWCKIYGAYYLGEGITLYPKSIYTDFNNVFIPGYYKDNIPYSVNDIMYSNDYVSYIVVSVNLTYTVSTTYRLYKNNNSNEIVKVSDGAYYNQMDKQYGLYTKRIDKINPNAVVTLGPYAGMSNTIYPYQLTYHATDTSLKNPLLTDYLNNVKPYRDPDPYVNTYYDSNFRNNIAKDILISNKSLDIPKLNNLSDSIDKETFFPNCFRIVYPYIVTTDIGDIFLFQGKKAYRYKEV